MLSALGAVFGALCAWIMYERTREIWCDPPAHDRAYYEERGLLPMRVSGGTR